MMKIQRLCWSLNTKQILMTMIPKLHASDMQDLTEWATEVFPELQQKKHEKLKEQVANEIHEYMFKNFLLRFDKYTMLELLGDNSQDISRMVYAKHPELPRAI